MEGEEIGVGDRGFELFSGCVLPFGVECLPIREKGLDMMEGRNVRSQYNGIHNAKRDSVSWARPRNHQRSSKGR